MSRKKRKKNKNPQQNKPATVENVQEILAAGKTQAALALAKRLVKESPGVEAELCLSIVYKKRIKELQISGLVCDANSLIEIAKDKCPNFKNEFEILSENNYHFPLSSEDIAKIFHLLQNPAKDKNTRKKLLDTLRIGLSDPRHLIDSNIPKEAILKQEAILVWDAFTAITENIDEMDRKKHFERLAGISRQSPLAPWCFFIRALDAYHNYNDALAEKLLIRIPDESALTPAKYVLQSKLKKHDVPTGLSSRATRELWRSLNPESPKSIWLDLMRAIEKRNIKEIVKRIDKALDTGLLSSPLALRAAFFSIDNKIKECDVYNHQIFQKIVNAYQDMLGDHGQLFYQLDLAYALGEEEPSFAADKYEDIVDEWSHLLTRKEKAVILGRGAKFAIMEESDLEPPSIFFRYKSQKVDHTDSIRLYKRAIKFDPQPEYYEMLLSLMRTENRKTKEIENLLDQWRKHFPNDCMPLIHLFENAEKRNVLQKALKFLEEAERLDHLNPKVRNARQRLVWQMAIKHLKQKKYQLAQRDLQNLKSLEMKPNTEAIFKSLERFIHLCCKEPDPGPGETDPTFSTILMHHLDNATSTGIATHLNKAAPLCDLDTGDKLNAYYILREALEPFGELIKMPQNWFDRFPKWIIKADHLTDELLIRISRTIITNGIPSVVMASTARGLKKDNPHLHEFLFYRAVALLKDDPFMDDEAEECIYTVITLCRAKGDYSIERQAVEFLQQMRRGIPGSDFMMDDDDDISPIIELSPKEIDKIIKRERKRNVLKKKRKQSSNNIMNPFGEGKLPARSILSAMTNMINAAKDMEEMEYLDDEFPIDIKDKDIKNIKDIMDMENKLQSLFWNSEEDEEEIS